MAQQRVSASRTLCTAWFHQQSKVQIQIANSKYLYFLKYLCSSLNNTWPLNIHTSTSILLIFQKKLITKLWLSPVLHNNITQVNPSFSWSIESHEVALKSISPPPNRPPTTHLLETTSYLKLNQNQSKATKINCNIKYSISISLFNFTFIFNFVATAVIHL